MFPKEAIDECLFNGSDNYDTADGPKCVVLHQFDGDMKFTVSHYNVLNFQHGEKILRFSDWGIRSVGLLAASVLNHSPNEQFNLLYSLTVLIVVP